MPSFVKPMSDKEVSTGESAVLQCMAGGIPKPTILWLKDGRPITATERHFFTAEDQLMIIIDTNLSDAGIYICQLNNSLGVITGSSQLIVKPSKLIMKSKFICPSNVLDISLFSILRLVDN